jgi:SPP1 gp7 family putative phage head morphogenesis protein
MNEGSSLLSVLVLRLTDRDLIAYDETGAGVWLTRKKAGRTRFNPIAHQRRVLTDARLLENRVWIPALQKFFVEQANAIARRMNSRSRRLVKHLREERLAPTAAEVKADATRKAKAMVNDFFDQGAFESELKSVVKGLYEEVIDTALTSTSVSMGVDFDLAPRKAVTRLVTKRANQLADHVSSSTYNQLQRVMRDGIIDGKSIPDIASQVQSRLQGASTRRATTIARTEVISAYNGGVYETANELPRDVVAGSMWIATLDERTRPAHADANGQVQELGEDFIVDGEELKYPGDPDGDASNIINCRCTTAILTPEEMEGRSVPMHSVSDILVRMSIHSISYRQALQQLTCE